LIPFADKFESLFKAVGVPLVIGEQLGASATTFEHSVDGTLRLGPEVLVDRIIYFSFTAQMINLITETVVPVVLGNYKKRKESQKVFAAAKVATKEMEKTGSPILASPAKSFSHEQVASELDAEELAFFERIKEESNKPEYDVYGDFSEIANQFGLLVLFSASWPLVPLVCLINNFLELRSDALKIAKTAR
jgi:hypothetical protein